MYDWYCAQISLAILFRLSSAPTLFPPLSVFAILWWSSPLSFGFWMLASSVTSRTVASVGSWDSTKLCKAQTACTSLAWVLILYSGAAAIILYLLLMTPKHRSMQLRALEWRKLNNSLASWGLNKYERWSEKMPEILTDHVLFPIPSSDNGLVEKESEYHLARNILHLQDTFSQVEW